jgi:hypothetical protein
MENLTLERIEELQAEYGLTTAQNLMNSGDIWKFEGSVGRSASDMLGAGILMLPDERKYDYYGTIVPARSEVLDGTKGTLGNAQRFWSLVEDDDYGAIDYAEIFRNFMNFGLSNDAEVHF